MMSRVPAALICALATIQIVHAQSPTPRIETAPAARSADTAAKLPVRRVVLYKNGIGFFEHVGKIRGAQAVTIDFNSSQLNDVLKSLTTLDLGNGRITNISYNSEAPFAQQLGVLRLPLGEQTTLAEFFGALRGARLEVRAGASPIVGRLLSVEQRAHGRGPDEVQRDEITLVTDSGEVRSIELSPAVAIKLAERDSTDQVSRYLSLLASTRAQDQRRMVIATAGTGERDLLVSYVSEVPIWKTTYRIVLPSAAGGKTLLQAWAIVDNTIGEDWNGVELSLVAGAPQSFIQQLSQPYFAQRPVIPLPRSVLLAPQTHQATLRAGTGGVHGKVNDASGGTLPGVTVRLLDQNGSSVSQAVTNGNGEYVLRGVPAGSYRVEFTLTGFRPFSANVDVEGGLETARNAEMGAAPVTEAVTVTGQSAMRGRTLNFEAGKAGGVVGGVAGGVAAAPPALDRFAIEAKLAEAQASARGEDLGDLFQYRVTEPITIRRNQSALVPIAAIEVAAERVSLWNEQAGGTRPLRALWLTNSSALTLDSGSFTVLEDAAFAGEGLVEALKPGEKRLLSYAVDLGVQVDAKHGDSHQRLTRLRIERGVFVQQSEERSERVYTIRNNDTTPRTIVVEHPVRAGWTLAAGVEPAETSAGAYRFRVPVAAKKEAALTVSETHPLETHVAIGQLTDDQIEVFLRGVSDNRALVQALAPIRAKKSAIATLAADLNARQSEVNRIGQDQARVRENMKALKGTSEEQSLVKRYATELNRQEDRLQALRNEVTDLEQKRQQAQEELARMLEGLSLDVDVGKL